MPNSPQPSKFISRVKLGQMRRSIEPVIKKSPEQKHYFNKDARKFVNGSPAYIDTPPIFQSFSHKELPKKSFLPAITKTPELGKSISFKQLTEGRDTPMSSNWNITAVDNYRIVTPSSMSEVQNRIMAGRFARNVHKRSVDAGRRKVPYFNNTGRSSI